MKLLHLTLEARNTDTSTFLVKGGKTGGNLGVELDGLTNLNLASDNL